MVKGLDHINVQDWQTHFRYHGDLNANHKQVVWFWETVREMNHKQKLRLYEFITGQKRPPCHGFAYIDPPCSLQILSVPKLNEDNQVMPKSMRSTNTLRMPIYSDKETLQHKLQLAPSSRRR